MTTKIEEDNFYRTSDLALATAIFLFYPLETVDRQNPRKAQFMFKWDKKLQKLIEDYWRGELRVAPQEYFNALRIIKARLYGEE